jgi:hypothetical protein
VQVADVPAACLLWIADQLIQGDTAAVREEIRTLLPDRTGRANRAGWPLTFLKTDEATYFARARRGSPPGTLPRPLDTQPRAAPPAGAADSARPRAHSPAPAHRRVKGRSGLLPRVPKIARHRQILAKLPTTVGLTPVRGADDRFDEFVLAARTSLRRMIKETSKP